MSQTNQRYSSDDDFYIGYKSLPASLKKRYWLLAIVLVICAPLAAMAIASQQKSAGNGSWKTDAMVSVSGVLEISPYPLVRVPAANGQPEHSVLLIQIGKHTATGLVSEHAGKQVEISGIAIERGGWKMLEVASPDAVVPVDTPTDITEQAAVSLGSVTMQGEIVGSKCFLGVMKPGSGAVHKACAELCLLGGVPPMFAVTDKQGNRFGYLLVSNDNQSMSTALAQITAEPVEISGELEQRGDLIYFKLDSKEAVVRL